MSDFLSSAVSTASKALGWSNASTDEVSIVTGGLQISGWESVEIHTGIEIMPWSFVLETTEFYPGDESAITILEGASCQIMIGNDLVITGWVLDVLRRVTARGHVVQVTGASKSVDLVECCAEFSTYQTNSTSSIALANKVCKPFNIQVIADDYPSPTSIPQFSVILTETPYEIIERVCRFAAILFYDRPDGNITMGPVAAASAASGFVEGQNVEAFSALRSQVGRYSTVTAILMNTNTLFTSPDENNLLGQMSNLTIGTPVTDAQITRYRPLLILPENGDFNFEVTKQRAQWEVNRRYGRSQVVEVTCDSWRDSAGALWTPNTLASVTLPSVKCTPKGGLLISEIVFRRDLDGTYAEITLMPSQAFDPEPIVINPMASEITQAARELDVSGTPSQAQPTLPAPGGPT